MLDRPPPDLPATSILDLIGHTPMVEIRRLNPNPRVTIFAKLEGFNPTGSIKDRIALKMMSRPSARVRFRRARPSWSRPAATPASLWP